MSNEQTMTAGFGTHRAAGVRRLFGLTLGLACLSLPQLPATAALVHGEIQGAVVDSANQPIAACVQLYDESRNLRRWTQGSASGRYQFDDVLPGAYKVLFKECAGGAAVGSPMRGLVSEWFDDSREFEGASLVEVSPGETVGNVDAALALGGIVRGRVASSGTPVEGMSVEAYDSDGARWGGSVTDAEGLYAIDALPPGTYRLFAYDYALPDHGWPPRYHGRTWSAPIAVGEATEFSQDLDVIETVAPVGVVRATGMVGRVPGSSGAISHADTGERTSRTSATGSATGSYDDLWPTRLTSARSVVHIRHGSASSESEVVTAGIISVESMKVRVEVTCLARSGTVRVGRLVVGGSVLEVAGNVGPNTIFALPAGSITLNEQVMTEFGLEVVGLRLRMDDGSDIRIGAASARLEECPERAGN